MTDKREVFISVDVEASGPIPGDYSLLSLGACVIGEKGKEFYTEFKPLNDNSIPAALKVTGFDMAKLAESGEDPVLAMKKLASWIKLIAADAKPVFVGFNAGFDWSFVNWYFIHFLSENPFGFAPLDVKSYYMGLTGSSWEETKSSRIRPEFQPAEQGNHNALNDARAQCEMFEKMLLMSTRN